MQTAEVIWFNGRIVPWEEARVHVLAHALHYGSSVFEGIRAYATPEGPAVFCLDAHLQRLIDSCRIARMELPYTRAELAEAIATLIRRNGHQSCYIRPVVFRGVGSLSLDARKASLEVAIATFEWGRYLGEEALEQGVDVMVSSWRRVATDTVATMAKMGGNYVNSSFVAMEAADHGFAEGIALDVHGYVSEGSGENIFVVRQGVVHTPPLSSGILPGVTRQVVMTLCADLGIPVRESLIPREMLYVADEVFFTGTAAEITPVRSVDRVPVGTGRRGPITERLMAEFFGIAEGHLPDRHGWRTPVAAAHRAAAT
ncbi:MAG: branched-chain amino acid transaminase [Armatimonadota bacterium]|nr:branched-chain amino acid transaminase [Armatimonadota bacterium]MDR7447836.1 branched-chain amino acid transaminase [Armatimonadota bacterium]MDR7459853.1 branched-chain amino acid transaminase [Armatimonadota bacterium]MDR7479815.1 branched-chain amino acid transaminase [Armatimonadota bacterium]MDR7487522.1 branched-chain amino acid transaminase [Armatimonadota bacterium]